MEDFYWIIEMDDMLDHEHNVYKEADFERATDLFVDLRVRFEERANEIFKHLEVEKAGYGHFRMYCEDVEGCYELIMARNL